MNIRIVLQERLNGPYQVAKRLKPTMVDGKLEDVPDGFEVVLEGYGAITGVYLMAQPAFDEAERLNTDFFELLGLNLAASDFPTPAIKISNKEVRKYLEALTAAMDRFRLEAKPAEPTPRNPTPKSGGGRRWGRRGSG